jgi:hypothetical protein
VPAWKQNVVPEGYRLRRASMSLAGTTVTPEHDVGERLGDGLGKRLGDGLGERVGLGERLGLGEGMGDGLGLGLGLALGLGLGLGESPVVT